MITLVDLQQLEGGARSIALCLGPCFTYGSLMWSCTHWRLVLFFAMT
jgi:hypothetical protein